MADFYVSKLARIGCKTRTVSSTAGVVFDGQVIGSIQRVCRESLQIELAKIEYFQWIRPGLI